MLGNIKNKKEDIENFLVDKRVDNTKTFAVYIFLFFFIILIIIAGYFVYQEYFQKDNNYDFSQLVDPDFNKIFWDINNPDDKEGEKEYDEIKTPDCVYQGHTFKHGDRVVLYSRDTVDPYDSCDRYRTERVCSAGVLDGEERFRFFDCHPLVDCKTSDGDLVKNGQSVELYSRYKVSYGDDCNRYKGNVKCIEGKLVGGDRFEFKNCQVSMEGTCKLDDKILKNGETGTFYQKDFVSFNEKCSDFSTRRFCDNGFLQGDKDYQFSSCHREAAKSCYLDDVEVPHGSSRFFYSQQRPTGGKTCQWFVQKRECQDGVLSGMEEYKYANCE